MDEKIGTSSNIEPVDGGLLRHVAGAFATGIAVAAVEKEDEIFAMTANSFLSVSLTPPLVLISIQHGANLLAALELGADLGISILHEDQQDASRHFAGEEGVLTDIAFDHKHDCPIWPDCLAYFATEVHRLVECGDHTLVICQVLHCQRDDGKPLLYYGGYRRLMVE